MRPHGTTNDRFSTLAAIIAASTHSTEASRCGDSGDDDLFGDAGVDRLQGRESFDVLDGDDGADSCQQDGGSEIFSC